MRDVLRIESERLTLRRPGDADCGRIAQFLADSGVSRMTASVPHPYPAVAAQGWLMLQRARAHLGQDFVFAIDAPGEGLIGMVGLHLREGRNIIGYWLGRPYWGQGFATEAVKAFVAEAEAFGDLDADHFIDNPASGRVLEKAGFKPTGVIEPSFSLARGESHPVRRMTRAPRRASRAAQHAEMCAC